MLDLLNLLINHFTGFWYQFKNPLLSIMHISSLILYLSHSYSPGPSSHLVTPILAMPILIIRVWYKCGPLHESVSYNAACRLLQFGLNQSWKPRKDLRKMMGSQKDRKNLSFVLFLSFCYPFSILLRSHHFPILSRFSALHDQLGI